MSASSPQSGVASTMLVLTSLNLLNFVDRYAPSAVKDLFKAELQLSDQQTALPFSAFVLVYMVACPIFGTLAERGRRPLLLAIGVFIWSLATAAGAFAQGFLGLLLARSLVGVGEAAFVTIAPALIADLVPPARRNTLLTLLNVATPIGVAVGFSLAGLFGQLWGWRAAFLVVGAPGVLLGLLTLRLKDPPRGQHDVPQGVQQDGQPHAAPSWGAVLRELRSNRRYLLTVVGYIAMTFALGGIGDWFPTFLSRERGFTLAEAGSAAGLSIVVGGLFGTLIGGWLADVLRRRMREGYLVLCGASCIPGLLLAGWAIFYARGKLEVTVALALAQLFLWMYNGPVNALLVNSVDVGMRARAFGLALLFTHLLGDVISPPIIGSVSEATGSVATGIGVALLALVVAVVAWLGGALVIGTRVIGGRADAAR